MGNCQEVDAHIAPKTTVKDSSIQAITRQMAGSEAKDFVSSTGTFSEA
jgi:hypothetical protein